MKFRSILVISTDHMIEYSFRRLPHSSRPVVGAQPVDFGLYRGSAWCAELLSH
jgi:hypothetical protein